MLRESNQPSKFWADAISYASYLANKSPNSALNGTIPFELWTGEQVDLFHLKVFGCKALAHVPRIQRSKMAPTSKPCVMLGYATNQKGYRLWRLKLQKVIVIRDAVFFESVYPFNKMPIPFIYRQFRVSVQICHFLTPTFKIRQRRNRKSEYCFPRRPVYQSR